MIVDNKTELELMDDIAHVSWGGKWRIPSKEQFQELLENCGVGFNKYNKTNCLIITSKINSKVIYLPAANYIGSATWLGGSYYDYWSRNLHETENNKAYVLCFDSKNWGIGYSDRRAIYRIRPVIEMK